MEVFFRKVGPVGTPLAQEARDERRLLNLQRNLSRLNLLIIDELGFVLLPPTGLNSSSRSSPVFPIWLKQVMR